jgi:UDP-N-acetylmuramoyl-tripeptide--D-alanyl-D-alanine ligase
MEPISIAEVLSASSGTLVAGTDTGVVGAVCTDTRKLRPGDLFIALEGRNFNGHDYLAEAVGKGCRGIVYSRKVTAEDAAAWGARGVALIRVSDTLDAFAHIAHRYRRRFELPLVAVTGSNGKTTTKEMIRTIASTRFSVLASEGTFNNFVGVPLTLLRLEAWHTLAVLELGMNARGEIRRLAEIAAPEIGVITNVGPAHLEFLETLENVAAAKAELLDAMAAPGRGRGRTAILNLDDPRVAAMGAGAGLALKTFGMAEGADVRAEDVHAGESGVGFLMRFRKAGRAVRVTLPVFGVHNVSNALAAAAACETLGIDPEQIAGALRGMRLPPMRMEALSRGGVTVINDAYNANPDSMRAAVETLAAMKTRGRRILVIGDMLELGGASDRAHREIGALTARRGIDALIAVGPHSASAADAAAGAGMPPGSVVRCAGAREAAEALWAIAREGDCVLLKASRRMGLEKILEEPE